MSRDDFNIKEKYYANDVFIPDVVKILEEGHTVTLKLRGISMRPFLEDNRDKALITKARNLKRGDIVLAEVAPKLYVLHRIVKIDADNVVLRGDGNLNCEYCKLSDVKGFVIGFYRRVDPDLIRQMVVNGLCILFCGRTFYRLGVIYWLFTDAYVILMSIKSIKVYIRKENRSII